MVKFDSGETALTIAGPTDDNISSSVMRILANKTGVQLRRPGEKFYLHKTTLQQKGIRDHHQFAWSQFAPFAMWQH